MNDVIRGKIIHVAKMAIKDESSVDVDFAVCSNKKECFYFIPSLRTADAFPVVASLPPKIAIFRRGGSDDRKCVCCSQSTLYQEKYFLYTMSLWVCYRNSKAFVQRYSWVDVIEGKRELI